MANPVINNLTGSMGTYLNAPIVNISFNLQHADSFTTDIVSPSGFQYELESNPDVWLAGTLDSSTPGTDMQSFPTAPGRSTSLKWDVKTDQDGLDGNVRVRLNLIDPSGNQSGYVSSSYFAIDTVDPTVSFTLPSFTNQQSMTFSFDTTLSPTHYRTSESASLAGASWVAISGDASITFTTADEETKNVYLQVRDSYYNTSTIASDSIILHSTAPVNTFLRINGTIPEVYTYTGMKINDDGSFTSDRTVSLDLYAEDLYNLEMYIDGDIEDGALIRTWVPYQASVNATLTGLDYNYDADNDVQVTFRDEAMNTSLESQTIRLNTKVYDTANTLLREQDAGYAHQIFEVTNVGTTNILSETVSVNDSFTRRWQEVFYPTTHDYPRLSDGTINESECVAMNQSSNTNYDAVQLDSGAVLYDEEERPVTVDWTDDGTKDYQNLESSYVGNLTYWVVDNTGYGDIDLEFEHFDISPNSFGPPFNNISPYDGDHLVIYDASADGAVQETVDYQGNRSYVLLDSSKLVELYAYSGSGNQVIELSTGYSVNADINGGFTVPTIRAISTIAMILYTDASSTASGFKLKAGPKHSTVFRNWDVDETNGEVWIHKYPNGQGYSGDIRMVYDYYDTDISVDNDAGEVTFKVDPSGVVSADYTYYLQDQHKLAADYSRLFTTSHDDFVDYLDPSMYVTPSGYAINKAASYLHGYPTAISPSGRIAANFTIDKDRGIVEFYDGTINHADEYAYVPDGRITIDYFYHTYKRLTNDGYGTLTFRDDTLVADETPLFPDYTWIDVKIVNEGDSILEDGKIKFLSRGYDNDNDGIIDQVLDVNRPWDIQEGTSAETYDKTAMQVNQNYIFPSYIDKDAAKSILSTWKNATFGFDVYPRTIFYGRVVWVLGGTSGTSYPSTTVGRKTFSSEIEGKFYTVET